MIEARESILSRQGDDNYVDSLKRSFDTFCPVKTTPYENNPFFACVERAGLFAKVSCWLIKLRINPLNIFPENANANLKKGGHIDRFQFNLVENGQKYEDN